LKAFECELTARKENVEAKEVALADEKEAVEKKLEEAKRFWNDAVSIRDEAASDLHTLSNRHLERLQHSSRDAEEEVGLFSVHTHDPVVSDAPAMGSSYRPPGTSSDLHHPIPRARVRFESNELAQQPVEETVGRFTTGAVGLPLTRKQTQGGIPFHSNYRN
jgi:hypothetical protein